MLPSSARMAVGSFLSEDSNRVQVLGVGENEAGYVVRLEARGC